MIGESPRECVDVPRYEDPILSLGPKQDLPVVRAARKIGAVTNLDQVDRQVAGRVVSRHGVP
jgi:hypothetical protein